MATARFVGGVSNGSGQWTWSNGANWQGSLKPSTGEDVSVSYASNTNNTPSYVDQTFVVGALTIQQAAPVEVLSGGNLTVDGVVSGSSLLKVDTGGVLTGTVDRGMNLDIAGGTATFTGTIGKVSFEKSIAVTVSGGGHLTALNGIYGASVAVSGGSTLDISNLGTRDPDATGSPAYIRFSGTGNELVLGGPDASGSAYTGGPISGLANGDLLAFGNGVLGAVSRVQFLGNSQGGVLVATEGTGPSAQTFTIPIASNSLRNRQFSPVSNGTIDLGASTDASCYAEGTLIATPDGACAVEALRAGDTVLLASGSTAPVVWMGRRTLDLRRVPSGRPVLIRADAFAPGAPSRDLRVSPDHAIFVDGVLIPAARLLNGSTITIDDAAERVTYFHVELPTHAVLLAEGLPAESWLDTGNRTMFENAAVTALHPSFDVDPAAIWASGACAPLVEDGAVLDAVRARLQARAETIQGPRGCVVAISGTGTVRTHVPANVGIVQLTSSSRRIADDRRRLGVLVTALRLDGVALPLDGARYGHGFHAVETHGMRAVRWTDGAAVLAIGAEPRDRVIEIDVAALAAESERDRAA